MPSLDNNLLDDQLLLDGSVTFSDGQYSDTSAVAAPENSICSGLNVDFNSTGGLVTRVGTSSVVGFTVTGSWESQVSQWQLLSSYFSATYTAPIRDVFYYSSPGFERVAFTDGGTSPTCIKLTGELIGTSALPSSTHDENVYFAQLTDKLYYCDAVNPLRYIVVSSATTSPITAGRVMSVEMVEKGRGYTTAPAVTIAASTGSTAVLLSHLNPDGEVGRITVSNQGTGYSSDITLTVAAAPAGGVRATAIAHLSETPLKAKFLVSHTSRLFCASDDSSSTTDTVYVSDILDGEAWSLISNSVRIGGGEGDPITALFSWFGYKLLVFKQRSVWVVNADPAQDVGDWTVELITNSTGCVAHKTVRMVGNDVFFLSVNGVESLSTIQNGAQTGLSLPISTPIRDAIEAINQTYASRSSAIYYRNRYIISFPTVSADISDTYVYNTVQKAWSGGWSGWRPRSYVITSFGGKPRLSFGDESGSLLTWNDYFAQSSLNESHFTDAGIAYPSTVITKPYNFGEFYGDKFGYQVMFELDNTFQNPQPVEFFQFANLDISNFEIITNDEYTINTQDSFYISTQQSRLFPPTTIPALKSLYRKSFNIQSRGRFAEAQFSATTPSGRLSLHSVKASAFSDTIRPEV